MLELIAKDVIRSRSFRRAIKIAPAKIRPFTKRDVQDLGPAFLDLEGREHRVEIGRYLCVGIEGERWTCSQKSMESRVAISEPDEEGFRLYVQRDPQPVLVTLIDESFSLLLPDGGRWTSQSGFVTWNGLEGDGLLMRVVEKNIFHQTYQFLTD